MASLPQNLPWDRAQIPWAQALNPIVGNAILSGTQALSGVTLNASTAKSFAHGLNRQPLGWFLTDIMSNAVVWRTAWDSNTITLEASADTTISVWIF